jgi:phage FluMu gp28-like protein
MTEILPGRHPDDTPPVLLPYQREMLETTSLHPVTVVEKSRRIGASWTFAYLAVETAALGRAGGGMDALYIGYNLDMAREFIDDAAFWARALHGFAAEVEATVWRETVGGKEVEILAFRVAFPSGFEIKALSSKPRSLRSRQGLVIIDEAAFHDDLPGLMKAALAMLIWGGRVIVLSTHEGADNPFNELVEDIRAGRRDYGLMRVTFDDAVAEGLYARICLVRGKAWTPAAEAEWVASIRGIYGEDAAEELDVVPSQGAGVVLSRAVIDRCMSAAGRVVWWHCPAGFELEPDAVRDAEARAWINDELDPLLDLMAPGLLTFLGGDFGRSGDLTVFMPGQKAGAVLRVPFVVELRNCPFKEQETILAHVLRAVPRLGAAALDARGLGASMAERAMQQFGAGRVAQVMTSQAWYRENMPGYIARFEDATIELPRDGDLRQDLRSLRRDKGVISVPEGLRFRSERGGRRHGDAAIAGAMLHFAAGMDIAAYGYETPAGARSPFSPRGAHSHDGPPPDEDRRARGWHGVNGAW